MSNGIACPECGSYDTEVWKAEFPDEPELLKCWACDLESELE